MSPTCKSLHIRKITNRLKKKPKNPMKNKTMAVVVYPQGGISPNAIVTDASSSLCPSWLLTKLIFVTDNVFEVIIMKSSHCIACSHSSKRLNLNWLLQCTLAWDKYLDSYNSICFDHFIMLIDNALKFAKIYFLQTSLNIWKCSDLVTQKIILLSKKEAHYVELFLYKIHPLYVHSIFW